MSKSQPAPLSIPGMPKKGEAAPVLTSVEMASSEPMPVSPLVAPPAAYQPQEAPSARLSSRVRATIAVTVRLDERRYERMKTWGMGRRVTNQEVIVAALDRFFRLSDEEREDTIASVRR